MDIRVRPFVEASPGKQPMEVVERKGLGHPDTICDGVAEAVSRALCRHYLDRFGAILHHNVDKVLLVGGVAEPKFGGGRVVEPIEIYIAGRVTSEVRGEKVAVDRIAIEACRAWLGRHLRFLDVERHVRIIPRLRHGSQDLTALFERRGGGLLANDTSCGAGFAPLSDLERVVGSVEAALNAPSTKAAHPAIGEDVKVMGTRVDDRIELTVGCAFVDAHLRDMAEYQRAKEDARRVALDAARAVSHLAPEVRINAADDIEAGDVYLTVTGTSAESGDDGEVGRGNRTNGLITPYRPMTLEAAAGKNPVTHVGKLYNLVATRIADSVVRGLDDVSEATCVLVSCIGSPVEEPAFVDVRLTGASTDATADRVRAIVRDELARLSALRDALLREELTVY